MANHQRLVREFAVQKIRQRCVEFLHLRFAHAAGAYAVAGADAAAARTAKVIVTAGPISRL